MNKCIKIYWSVVFGFTILISLLTIANATENVNLSISYLPEKPIVFEETIFNAILDKEIDESNAFYEWNFGDGFRMEGRSIPHRYTQAGKFIVSLTLKEGDETIGSKTARVRVYGPKPKIDYFNAEPKTIISGQKTILSWDTSNATSVTIDPLPVIIPLKGMRYVYPSKDTTFTLRAINPDWTDERQVTVIVKPKPPSPPKAVIDYSPSEPKPFQDIIFDGSRSSDEDGIITSYFWDFGGEYGSDKKVVSHRYTNGDMYTVKLTVTDNNGTKDTSSVSVPVLNRNHWGRYFSTISSVSSDDRNEFFKGYYEGYLFEQSKTPYVEGGVRRILDNRNVEEKFRILRLLDGYELAIKSIDIDNNKVYLELSKDGSVVDSRVISPFKTYPTEADMTYCYKKPVSVGSNLVTIAVHFKEANSDYLVSDSIWQLSDEIS